MSEDNGHGKDIVLGNRQLLSIFFIVVVLMGVAFTLGYTIGRNTATVSAATTSPAPQIRERSPSSPPRDDPSKANDRELASGAMSSPDSDSDTNQGKPSASSVAKPPREPLKTASTAAAENSASIERPQPDLAAAATGTPAPGSYLQVAALKRVDADHIVKILRDRSFPALLGESPREGLYRVLVGPFKTMQDLSDSKQRLRAAGFEAIVAR